MFIFCGCDNGVLGKAESSNGITFDNYEPANTAHQELMSILQQFLNTYGESVARVKREIKKRVSTNGRNCTKEHGDEVAKCIRGLLPSLNFGIPSNHHETETVCT